MSRTVQRRGIMPGVISIKLDGKIIKQLNLNLQVLPITLLDPYIEYSLYYRGRITEAGSIHSEYKTVEQFTAEHADMMAHGVTNPTVFPASTDEGLIQRLTIRNSVGMDNSNLYYYFDNTAGELTTPEKMAHAIELTAPYGVTQIYSYGQDERSVNDPTNRAKMTAIHKVGGKVMVTQFQKTLISG